ncbi:YggT family protein [Fictibacillus iocasae]|uniref:YggT family protein n=1 Tax=Fictibacillus iocasae TaxID=2715437 RepID=A0ABW2NW25_9BACL
MGRAVAMIISIVVGVIQAILGLRLLFKLFGANENAPFVQLVLSLSEPLLYPFRAIFPMIDIGRFELELSTLVAIIVYGIAGYFLRRLFTVGRTRKDRDVIIRERGTPSKF